MVFRARTVYFSVLSVRSKPSSFSRDSGPGRRVGFNVAHETAFRSVGASGNRALLFRDCSDLTIPASTGRQPVQKSTIILEKLHRTCEMPGIPDWGSCSKLQVQDSSGLRGRHEFEKEHHTIRRRSAGSSSLNPSSRHLLGRFIATECQHHQQHHYKQRGTRDSVSPADGPTPCTPRSNQSLHSLQQPGGPRL